jgi:hypothetical protein
MYSPQVNGSAYASQCDANQHQPNKETNKAAKQDEHYKREACARVSCFNALFVPHKQNLYIFIALLLHSAVHCMCDRPASTANSVMHA